MRGAISVAVLIVILTVGGFFVISSTRNIPPTSPSSTSGMQVARVSTLNPNTNLEFQVALNASTTEQGRTLAVSFNLFNTLDRMNNLTSADNWRVTNASESSGSSRGWNCAQDDVFRIEVLGGNYGLNNYSKGNPIDVFVWFPPYAFNECAYYAQSGGVFTLPWQGQNNYAFGPKSNIAWWTTAQMWGVRCGPGPANATTTTATYSCPRVGQGMVMNETMILKTGVFVSSPGWFTIVGGDEWGDVEVLHFYVGSATGQTTTSGEICSPAITPTQTSAGTTTQVITLCHTESSITTS